jgi:hypothetical protein
VERLAPQRGLEPVGDVAGHLVDANGPLADLGVAGHRLVDAFFGGLLTAANVDERDQVRRVERVPEDHAFWMLRTGLRRSAISIGDATTSTVWPLRQA